MLDVELIKADAQMIDGDQIVTSYLSDKFLPGITIGYISNVQTDTSKLTMTANVTPIVDFDHLTDVLVITQLKEELISQDNQ